LLNNNPSLKTKKPLQIVERVQKYESVNNWFTSVKQLYNQTKNSSSLVKYGCETLESNVATGYQWVAPKVEPLTQSTLYKKTAEPLISTVDNLSCQSLDVLEKTYDTYQKSSLKPVVEQKIELARSKTQEAVETAAKYAEKGKEMAIKTVEPVDNYLQSSVLGVPLNKFLDTTEVICDHYFPEDPQASATPEPVKEGKVEEEKTPIPVQAGPVSKEGPLFRGGKLSKRVQKGLTRKLTNLKLRSPEQLQAMKYTVDLIQYAASSLEKGAQTTNAFVSDTFHKGVEFGSTQINTVKETSTKLVDNTRTRVQVLTKDALDSVNKAIEILSNQIPTEELKKVNSVATAKDFVLHQAEAFNLQQFQNLVPTSLEKLNHMKDVIGSKIATNENFSGPFIQSVLHRLSAIRSSLSSLLPSKSSSNLLLDVTQELEEKKSSENVETDESTDVEADEQHPEEMEQDK